MGKRSTFPKLSKDKYHTPFEAVLPLLPQLPAGTIFAEPCAGNGILIDHLMAAGHQCVLATDIEPERDDIGMTDALTLHNISADMVITNLPWTRSTMHPLISHLSSMIPCWFLFDASWPFTQQSSDLIRRCSKIVPVGRIKWFPDSRYLGFEDCAWYEFLPGHTIGPRLVPRQSVRNGHLVPMSIFKTSQVVEKIDTPAPSVGVPMANSSDLLSRLRSKMKPMNIPRLNIGK
jgi:hypothetical protein